MEIIIKNKLLITVGVVSLFISSSALAVTLGANATAIIKQAITVVQTQNMDFGTIAADATGGALTLSAVGVRTGTPAFSGTALAVTFSNGTLTSGVNNMAVNTFTHTSTPASDTTDGTGNLTVNVGANLVIAPNQVAGTYNGTYSIIVNY